MTDYNQDEQDNKFKSIKIMLLNEDGSSTVITTALDTIPNPYDFDLSSFLPNEKPLTLDKFFLLTKAVIEDAQREIKETEKVTLVEEYPPESMSEYGNEIITFKLINRKPGMMDTKGNSRPQRKHTYSHEYGDPSLPNKTVVVSSRPIDHTIEFNCWAVSNNLANKRALWLEKLLINCSFVYELNGAERFFWKERGADTYITVGNQRIFYRPIRFFLRFREFDAKIESNLRNILIESGIIK